MGFIANAICLSYIDKVGRKLPLAYTSCALVIDMILLMVFSKYYSNSANKVGEGFTIAWIFIFSFIFSLGWVGRVMLRCSEADWHRFNAIQLLYIAEIFPTALRSRATASKSCSQWLNPDLDLTKSQFAHSWERVSAFSSTSFLPRHSQRLDGGTMLSLLPVTQWRRSVSSSTTRKWTLCGILLGPD